VKTVLVDTNVVSYIYKKDSRGARYQHHLDNAVLVISFQTLAELSQWTLERNWGTKQKRALKKFLQDFSVVYASESLCDYYAQVMASARASGKPILSADAWVAAVALELAIPLVTHNPNDFRGVSGLEIITEV
jgi:tRNA(fMet)-specific endonuclease VapC